MRVRFQTWKRWKALAFMPKPTIAPKRTRGPRPNSRKKRHARYQAVRDNPDAWRDGVVNLLREQVYAEPYEGKARWAARGAQAVQDLLDNREGQ